MGRAQQQRAELVATLQSLTEDQWQAETLCAGWDAGDVAAHLVVREREPLAAAGIVFPPAARLLEARTAARRRAGREELLRRLADGPPWWMQAGRMDDVQAVEDWIHHEDVRRGGAGLPGRHATPDMVDVVWRAMTRFARLTLARAGREGVVALTDGTREHRLRVSRGSRVAQRTDAGPDVKIFGEAGELLLFVGGRSAATVEVSGDPAFQGALLSAPRGL